MEFGSKSLLTYYHGLITRIKLKKNRNNNLGLLTWAISWLLLWLGLGHICWNWIYTGLTFWLNFKILGLALFKENLTVLTNWLAKPSRSSIFLWANYFEVGYVALVHTDCCHGGSYDGVAWWFLMPDFVGNIQDIFAMCLWWRGCLLLQRS